MWVPSLAEPVPYNLFSSNFRTPQNRSGWLPRAAHGEAKRHFREILAPKLPPKWSQKVIEFWLQWNCDFCYPSHAKSRFSLPKTPPKMMQNLFKKRLCNQTPPKIFNFQPQGASGWQHEPKRLPKGLLLGRPGAPKIQKSSSKRDPKCGREPTPQNGPSFSPNGCQNVLPKQYNLAQILSKEVSRNVLNETNSGK